MIDIVEVSGLQSARRIRRLNSLEPSFPALTEQHLEGGHWWLALDGSGDAVGFAGMVPMIPFPGTWYLKRAYVIPPFRGRGLQGRFLELREIKARSIGASLLVSECDGDNAASARNFNRAGYETFVPEQVWGAPGSLYFMKVVA